MATIIEKIKGRIEHNDAGRDRVPSSSHQYAVYQSSSAAYEDVLKMFEQSAPFDQNELDMIETGILVDALERRSRSLLLMMEVPVKTDKNKWRNALYYNGGWVAALGLATASVDRVKEVRLEDMKDDGNT